MDNIMIDSFRSVSYMWRSNETFVKLVHPLAPNNFQPIPIICQNLGVYAQSLVIELLIFRENKK